MATRSKQSSSAEAPSNPPTREVARRRRWLAGLADAYLHGSDRSLAAVAAEFRELVRRRQEMRA